MRRKPATQRVRLRNGLLASCGLSLVLALEITFAGRATAAWAELRALIRRMSIDNPLWGAPRIHGELLKLGFKVAQSTVAKYMVKRWRRPSQGWRSFPRNHAPDIAAMDLFVVPTIGFSCSMPSSQSDCNSVASEAKADIRGLRS